MTTTKTRMFWAAVGFACIRLTLSGDHSSGLGTLLLEEGDPVGAAVEFRRAAMSAPGKPRREAAYYGAAGYAYLLGRRFEMAERMIDEMEDRDAERVVEIMLLRGEEARLRHDWGNAAFYYGAARRSAAEEGRDNLELYSGRNEMAAWVRIGDMPSAFHAAGQQPEAIANEAYAVLNRYSRGRDKRPWLGGLLGMIPGMGYLYSGETANAVRSMILNALFIYAMVDTSENEQWGAFAAVTFFEITWYSGSIYGGVDAAHRYNRARRDHAAGSLKGDGQLRMRAATLPVLVFSVDF